MLGRGILLLLATLTSWSTAAILRDLEDFEASLLLQVKTRLASLISNLGNAGSEEASECSFDHSGLDGLLKKHVKEPTVVNGIRSSLFDYKAVLASDADAAALSMYVDSLVDFDPSCLTSNGKLAFWANVYNAVIIHLVVSDSRAAGGVLPISIKDLAGNASVVWDRKACILNGKSMTLEEVLNEASRLKDPRVHAAVNCASLSCPDLRASAYSAENIQEELDAQVRAWLTNPSKGVRSVHDQLKVSPIFDWHEKDFPSLPSFLAKFLDKPVKSIEVSGRLSYNWNLNSFQESSASMR
jgi:hypothetical protein